MRPFPRLVLARVATLAAPAFALAQETGEHDHALAGIGEAPLAAPHDLARGAKLVFVPDFAEERVTGVWRFRAGSILDPADRVGIAEVASRILQSGGSEATSGEDLQEWIAARQIGLRFQCSFDRYDIRFVCKPEEFTELQERIGELVARPAYPETEVARARQRLARGLQRVVHAGAEADAKLREVIFGADSPWARQPDAAGIDAMTRDDVLAYHRRYLVPERLVIGVRGNVDLVATTELYDRLLAAVPDPAPGGDGAPLPSFEAPAKREIVLLDQRADHEAAVRMILPAPAWDSEHASALRLWSYVLAGDGQHGLGSRISERRVEVLPGWGHTGRLQVSFNCSPAAIGDAFGFTLETMQKASGPIPAEELDDARARALEGDFPAGESIIEQAMETAFQGAPADLWVRHAEALRTLTPAEVQAAARAFVAVEGAEGEPGDVRAFCAVAAPAVRAERALRPFGRVVVEEPEEVERLLAAMGGRPRWAELGAVQTDILFEMPSGTVASRQWRDLGAPRMRVDNALPSGLQTTVLNGDAGWIRNQTYLEDMSPEDVARARARKAHGLWDILHRLARRDALAARIDTGPQLVLSDDGELEVRIQLDEDGRPAQLAFDVGGEPTLYSYEDWAVADGYVYAATIRDQKHDTVWRVSRFEPLGAFDPALLERRE